MLWMKIMENGWNGRRPGLDVDAESVGPEAYSMIIFSRCTSCMGILGKDNFEKFS